MFSQLLIACQFSDQCFLFKKRKTNVASKRDGVNKRTLWETRGKIECVYVLVQTVSLGDYSITIEVFFRDFERQTRKLRGLRGETRNNRNLRILFYFLFFYLFIFFCPLNFVLLKYNVL